MDIRLSEPSYQVNLVVFLRNSGIFAVERIDGETVRVFEVEEKRLREMLAAWEGIHPGVRAELT
jgi:hypothetical protein